MKQDMPKITKGIRSMCTVIKGLRSRARPTRLHIRGRALVSAHTGVKAWHPFRSEKASERKEAQLSLRSWANPRCDEKTISYR